MPEKTYKITDKHFKYFKERVYFWQKTLGGTPYLIYCDRKKDGNKHNHAKFEKWEDTATIFIRLNTEIKGVEPTDEEIDSTAFHEVFEALYLSSLRGMATGTYSNFEVEQSTHKAVMMATNSIFKALRGY